MTEKCIIETNITNLPKLDIVSFLKNWAKVNLSSFRTTSGGSYIFLKKFHDKRRERNASENIIVNPVKADGPLNEFRKNPAVNVAPTLINPRSLFLHPKKFPLRPSGTWSAIRLDQAGMQRAFSNMYKVANSVRQAMALPPKIYGTSIIGIHMRACRSTHGLMSAIREPNLSTVDAVISWEALPARFGRAESMPICAVVAFMARAYGVMKFSLRPCVILANMPS